MNNLWSFSSSSKELLQQCIATATSHKPNEKWLQQFKHEKFKSDIFHESNCTASEKNYDKSPITIEESPDLAVMDVVMEEKENINEDVFIELVESEGIKKMEYITEKCLKNRNLLVKMAECLSNSCIEQICKHIFYEEYINPEFLNDFYLYFLPAFFQKNHNLQGLDLLKQAKSHTNVFKKLLIIVIRDLRIPNEFILSFISTSSVEEKKNFLNNLININLTDKEIVHNLLIIQECYKCCDKDVTIDNYILNILARISDACVTDKIYGKLMLLFLQNNEGHNNKLLETLVEVHQSSIKKACLTVLSKKL